MKRLLFSISVLTLLVVPQFAYSSELDELKAAVERFTQAFNSMDADAIAKMTHPGLVVVEANDPFPFVYSTPDAFKEGLQNWFSTLESINFFDINKQICFVDLPGYGYAKVPKSVKKEWGPMIETYLSTRKTLKGVVVIMDIRRVPRQEEMNLINWLNHFSIASILVLTKQDKLSKSKRIKQQSSIAQALAKNKNDLILYSAKSRQGRDTLWDAILSLVKIEADPTP